MRKALILAALLSLGEARASAFEDVKPLREIDQVRYELEDAIERSCGGELADKAEDALDKLEAARRELDERPADEQAVAGNLEGAIGDLEAAVEDGCFDTPTGIALMDDLAAVSRYLASRTLRQALRHGGKRDEIRAARQDLARGDALRGSGRRGRLVAFKQAVNEYRGAQSKAESAME